MAPRDYFFTFTPKEVFIHARLKRVKMAELKLLITYSRVQPHVTTFQEMVKDMVEI